jgi:hypothetical protein
MNPETANEQTITITLSPAERFYQNHLKRVSTYQKAHPEKCREKCKKYNDRLREQQPERYAEILQQKKDYYTAVRKPKLVAEREAKKQAKEMAKAIAV